MCRVDAAGRRGRVCHALVSRSHPPGWLASIDREVWRLRARTVDWRKFTWIDLSAPAHTAAPAVTRAPRVVDIRNRTTLAAERDARASTGYG
jgi:hypothetical protein